VTIARRGDACPGCGGYQLQPTGGTELQVVDLLVDDEPTDDVAPATADEPPALVGKGTI
jgi:hydrogenase nickel incorporation protein HypA/HybF